jgi:hypothetical protein
VTLRSAIGSVPDGGLVGIVEAHDAGRRQDHGAVRGATIDVRVALRVPVVQSRAALRTVERKARDLASADCSRVVGVNPLIVERESPSLEFPSVMRAVNAHAPSVRISSSSASRAE